MIMMEMTGNNNDNCYYYSSHLLYLSKYVMTTIHITGIYQIKSTVRFERAERKLDYNTIYIRKNSQSRVEKRETPPTSMVVSEMVQNSGTLYTL